MKTYFNRRVTVAEDQEIVRNVTEKNGVATVRYQGQKQEVATSSGSPDNHRETKWKLKK